MLTLARNITLLAFAALVLGCSMADPKQQAQDEYPSVTAAVAYRDEGAVEALLRAGRAPDERDDMGATPLITAAASDQWRIAEILLRHGADPFAHDRFGVTAAEFVATSRVLEESPDGQARQRIAERMRAAGVPIPPPPRPDILRLSAEGKWGGRR